MKQSSKSAVSGIVGAGLRGLALFVVVCAAIALAGLALGIVFAAAALLVLLLIFALIVNPGEVRMMAKVLGDRVSDLISRLEALIASFKEIIDQISQAARAASGMQPQADRSQAQKPEQAQAASPGEAIDQEKPQTTPSDKASK